MTSTRWAFIFLFPVVLNNIMLIDCASAKAKLLKALEEILPYFKNNFLLLSKTKRNYYFLLPRVFALNRRMKMRKEG